MKTHVTTNIRLGTTLYNDIKNVAFKRGISIAEFFRQLADAEINKRKNINDDPLWSLGSMPYDGGETAETDISANHDKYIYENINIR